jgi:hypothetical protein
MIIFAFREFFAAGFLRFFVLGRRLLHIRARQIMRIHQAQDLFKPVLLRGGKNRHSITQPRKREL